MCGPNALHSCFNYQMSTRISAQASTKASEQVSGLLIYDTAVLTNPECDFTQLTNNELQDELDFPEGSLKIVFKSQSVTDRMI